MRQGSLSWWWYRMTAPTAGKRQRNALRSARRAAMPKPRYISIDKNVARGRKYRVREVRGGAGGGRFPLMIAALVVLGLAAVFLLVIQSRMRPQVEQVAGAHIRNLASRAVNEAVNEAIARMGVAYDDLILFEKDNQGRITALKTDMVMANRVKADIHTAALANIVALADTDIGIPLGSLMSGDLVAGRGPKIRVRLVPVGAVDVSFSNEFSAAGINQTIHRVMINISTKISVLLPGSSTEQEVMVEVCVAETVIVGAVPDAYASLEKNPLFVN